MKSPILAISVFSLGTLAAVPIHGQCGGIGYSGDITCASGSCCTYLNDYYSQCLACSTGGDSSGDGSSEGSGGTTTTPSSPTGVTKTIPVSSGAVSTSKAIVVLAGETFDGGMKIYDRFPSVCQGQTETGESDAMFILEEGATLANVIIGPNQAEGVHCRGQCTLISVFWQDVCEDALTLKQSSSSANSYVIGGGAWHATDKIIQFNGRGSIHIQDFYASDYGKLVRSCGNCSGNGGPRKVYIDGVVAVNGGVLCGINTNYGDECVITGSCQNGGKSCDRYTGNGSGAEPRKVGSGPDGFYCTVAGLSRSC